MAGHRVAITGVPGTGKTSVAEALARRGARVVHLNEFARDAGLLGEMDAERGSHVVDMDELADRFNAEFDAHEGILYLESHFAHEMDVDQVVLLRLDPLALVKRLQARGWREAKVRENVEAEALDVLAQEVLDTDLPSMEIDCTSLAVEEVADAVSAIAEGRPEGLKARTVGTAHWSLESLPWF